MSVQPIESRATRIKMTTTRPRRLRAILASLVLACAAWLVLAAPAFADFGITGFDGSLSDLNGNPVAQAGAHPYAATTTFTFPREENGFPLENPKDIEVELPPGLAGNPQAVPKCTFQQFGAHECPQDTQIGILTFEINGTNSSVAAVYNMVPPFGQPAQFAAFAAFQVVLEIDVRTGSDYGLTVVTKNLSNGTPLTGNSITLWGVPAASSHDDQRCQNLDPFTVPPVCDDFEGQGTGLPHSSGAPLLPFLSLPTSCLGPQTTTMKSDSWEGRGLVDSFGRPLTSDPSWKVASFLSHDNSGNPIGNDGCNQVDFSPKVEAKPTTDLADAPSGLEFNLHLPQRQQEQNPEGIVEANLKNATVSLPQGLTVNPSSANGLAACSESQIGFLGGNGEGGYHFSPGAAECPDASKLGTVEINTAILESPLPGAVYLAAQGENPFSSLLALYLTVDDPKTGIVIKLPGKVEPDPTTGQLTATFAENPQLPFEDLKVDFFGGARGALRTPATCGSYQTNTDLTPWTTPEGVDAHPVDSFAIDRSATGGPCAANLLNQPAFDAGTLTPHAGIYSPFLLKLARGDGSQEISAIDTTLPAGMTGKLAGIPYCPESGLATAASRNKPGDGALELSSPSCPAASQVGTVSVGAGAGPTPFYANGKAYLAGPYKGAPLSLAVITPAIAGPFDLGDVMVRTALYVDPETARIHAVSDPFPRALQGIPLDIRSIGLNLNRNEFTLNPTSCEKMSVIGSSTSTLGQVASLTSPFQVGECSKLAFKPSLKISLKGQTRRTGHPALKAVLTYPKGSSYANVASAQVSLPHSEFLDQGNLNKVCTQPELKSQTCPASSIYGKVKAWTPLLEKPLEGNVYLGVGFGYKLPALVAELNGQIRVLLKGKVDTDKQKGIRNTFEAVPDAPVEKFVLEMKGGKKYGLLENSENICKTAQQAEARFTGQNGAVDSYKTKIANSCGKKSEGKKKAKGRKGSRRGKSHKGH
jgi:hypothetical protein